MIGLFGGHREGNETFLHCIVREVHEEIGYFIAPERFQLLGNHKGGDPEVDGGTVHAEYYFVRGVPAHLLHVTEGTLLTQR